LTATLLTLLDTHGGPALEAAVVVVNQRDITSANAVRLVLEQSARAQGKKPPTPVQLPREELSNLTVRSANLSSYDVTDQEQDDA
jgi:hypothetical protein